MGLRSVILNFKGDPRLEACLVSNPAHVRLGDSGVYVAKIQRALIQLDQLTIAEIELRQRFYGPSTAAAVLKYKQKRHIINFSYETVEDDIVGKMTIKSMDDELLRRFPYQFAKVDPKDFSFPKFDPVRAPKEGPKSKNFRIRCRSGYSIGPKVHLEFDIYDRDNDETAEYVYTGIATGIGIPISVTYPGPFKDFTTTVATTAGGFEAPANFDSAGGFSKSTSRLSLLSPPMIIPVNTGFTDGFDLVSISAGVLKLKGKYKGSPKAVKGGPTEA